MLSPSIVPSVAAVATGHRLDPEQTQQPAATPEHRLDPDDDRLPPEQAPNLTAPPSADRKLRLLDPPNPPADRDAASTEAASASPSHSPMTGEFHLSDLGNARRLVAEHGADLRYCYQLGKWFVWDGRRWTEDAMAAAERYAKATVCSMYARAASLPETHARKELARHALRSESHRQIAAMIALSRSEPGVPVLTDQLDLDPWALNVLNGTIDLRTGALRPHRRDDLITRLAPVVYDPDATCPTWTAFLEQILDGNLAMLAFLQRAIGYSLTGSTRERVLFLLHGAGSNGKSTLLEAVRAVLGEYAQRTPTQTLLARRDSTIPNDLARLRGARFVSAAETDEGRHLAEGLVKDLTGGDTIAARFLRAEWFDFRPEFKLWLATNHKPVIRGTDRGIWDRIRLIPFNVSIPDERQDKELAGKLMLELPGILGWAVKGCLDWQRAGLDLPEEVRDATEGYRTEMDTLAAFLDERCTVAPAESAAARDLYAAYRTWCEDTGERWTSQKAFGLRLRERGFTSERVGRAKVHTWLGVGLAEPCGPTFDPGYGGTANEEGPTSPDSWRRSV